METFCGREHPRLCHSLLYRYGDDCNGNQKITGKFEKTEILNSRFPNLFEIFADHFLHDYFGISDSTWSGSGNGGD